MHARVILGNPRQEAVATVKAETRRLMLERIRTAAGQFKTFSFTVNVRCPENAGLRLLQ